MRHELVAVRQRLTGLVGQFPDDYEHMDRRSSVMHSVGCIQGALVMLYEDMIRFDDRVKARAEIDALLSMASTIPSVIEGSESLRLGSTASKETAP